jgi:hypothetical protein
VRQGFPTKTCFVCGYPGGVGGANTELWHTVKLWRRHGLPVTLIPTAAPPATWRDRLETIGCRTCHVAADDLPGVPGLAGGVVVSISDTRFLAEARRFRRLGCKIVWLGCMNWLFPQERLHYRRYGVFDRYVFQSDYQRAELGPQLARHGYDESRGRIIHGALDVAEFPFRPRDHLAAETFVIGRLSRASPDKFSPNTWRIYGRVPGPIAARVMGWDASIEARVGRPPPWAECLPPGAETPQAFFSQVHCLAQAGGEAVENWPRVGLEAMAAGVPLVVERRGGWQEMIRHGQTGYLAGSDEEMTGCIARLAADRVQRRRIVEQARAAVENELADPNVLWRQWSELLEELQA